MSFGNIITFVQSLFAAQTIEPEIVGFSGVSLDQAGNILAVIGNIICELIYFLVKWILAVVDFLQYFIQKLIGLDYWLQPGSKTIEGATDNDLLFQFLYNDTVQNVFRAMVGVFIILLVVFVIFSIVKTEWKYATGDGKGGNSKMQIFRSSFKAFLLVLVFPLVLTLGIISSNAILASLVGALNLDMAQTFGGTLFSIAAEPANKYRIYSSTDQRAPVSQRITFYVENSTGKTILFSNGTTYPEDKYCTYYSNYNEYLSVIYGKVSGSPRCTEYTVDTVFDVVVPRNERNFSGYCVGLEVDGTTKYFLVKCTYSEKEGMYYYLRNILNGKVLSKNTTTNSNQGMTGNTVTELRKDLKDHIESTGKQSFISGADLHDYGSGAVIDAAYNTWGYASIFREVHSFEESQAFKVIYTDVLSRYEISTSITNAKVSFNSNLISPYFDGGQFGYVSKQAEYKVMADVIDFICNNNADLFMIDVTSSTILWNYGSYTDGISKYIGGGADRKTKVSAGSGLGDPTDSDDVLPFIVQYSDLCSDADMGNQLYLANYNTSSELEGAVYIMCWKVIDGGKTRYVPLINGRGYYNEATGQEFPTFKSEFYSNGYRGLVVAKGLLNNETTNQEYGEPTYITSGIDGVSGGVGGIEAPYYYNLTENSKMYQYGTSVTSTTTGDVSGSGRYEISNVLIANVDSTPVMATSAKGGKYFKIVGADGKERETSVGDIEGMTIHLKNRETLGSTTAVYAGLAMEYADADNNTSKLNNNTKYLFVTGEGGYFVVSACKNASEYFVHEITSYGSGKATVGGRDNDAKLNLMSFKTTIKAYYDNGTTTGNVEVATIGLNMVEPTSTKVGGKAVYKTVDMQYVSVPAINFSKSMYMNLTFDTDKTNLFSYSSSDNNKFKVASPVAYSASNTDILQGTVFFNLNYYDYTTGYVQNEDKLYRYDLYSSSTTATAVNNPIMTEVFGVNSAEFSWANDSVSYNLYDGDRYVATIYKPAGTSCTFNQIPTKTSYIMLEYQTFYNVRTQNTYSDKAAFEQESGKMRSSVVVSFNRDSLSSSSFIFDFRISLLGKGRLKLIMSTYKVERDDRKGYFYTSDSMAFDYFFDGEGTVNGNKIVLSTFYVPAKVASPFGVGLWIMLISSALIIKILGTALWGIIKRFYEITLYYIAMPAVASTIVLDDGKRFQTSIQNPLIAKVLSTYGVILGINAFFVLLAPVRSMSNVFTAEDIATSGSYFLKALSNLPLFGSFELTAKLLNSYTYILFLLVAFTMIQELPQLITRIMGTAKDGGDVVKSGADTKKQVKQTMNDAGKTLSGQGLMDGAAEAMGMAKGMIPGSALISAGAEKLGGLFKGGAGTSNREEEEETETGTDDTTTTTTENGQTDDKTGDGTDDEDSESARDNDLDLVEDIMNPDGDSGLLDTVADNAGEILTEGGGAAVTAIASAVTEGGTDVVADAVTTAVTTGAGDVVTDAVTTAVTTGAGDVVTDAVTTAVTTGAGDVVTDAVTTAVTEGGTDVVADAVTTAVTGDGTEVVDKVADAVENATGDKVAEEAGKKAGEKAEGEEEKKKGIMEEAREKSDKWSGAIKEGLTKFGSAIASPFKWIGEKAKDAGKWVGEKAQAVGKWTGDKFFQAKEAVKNIAGKVYGATLKPLGEGAKKLVEKGKNAVMTGASWVRNTAGSVKEKVANSRFVKGVANFAGGVKNKFMDGAAWVRGTAGRAKNWVVGAAGKVKDTAVGLATKVKDTAVGVAGRVKNSAFGKFVRKSVVNTVALGMTIAKPFKAAGKGIAKAAQAVYGKVLTPMGQGAKKLAEKASQGVSWVKQHSGTIKKVAKVAGAVGLTALTIANPMAGLAVGAGFVAAKAAKNVAVSVYGSVLKPIGQKAKSIAEKAQEGVSYIAQGVSSTAKGIGAGVGAVAGGLSARIAKKKNYVKDANGKYIPAGTTAGVAEKPEAMSVAEAGARDELDAATTEYETAKQERVQAEDAVYKKDTTRKAAERKKASNAKKREKLTEAFNNAEYGHEQDKIAAELRALDDDDKVQQAIIDENTVSQEERAGVVTARTKEATAKKAKTTAKKKVEAVIIAEEEKAEAEAKRQGMSEEAGAAHDAVEAAATEYETAKQERVQAENAVYKKDTTRKAAERKKASNAKKREQLTEQLNNTEAGHEQDRIAAELRALDDDDKVQQAIIDENTVSQEERDGVVAARTKEATAKKTKSSAKKHLDAVLREEAGGVNPEKVAEAKDKFKEVNGQYIAARTERIEAEEVVSGKQKAQKAAKKKIATLTQQIDESDRHEDETEGQYIQRMARNKEINKQIEAQQEIITANEVTEEETKRVEVAVANETTLRTQRAEARKAVTVARNNPTVVVSPSAETLEAASVAYAGELPVVIRGAGTTSTRTGATRTSGVRTPFVPANEDVLMSAREEYDGLTLASGPQGIYIPSTVSGLRLSTSAVAARRRSRGQADGLSISASRPSAVIARDRYNLDKVNDVSVVADKGAALANVVRNQTNTKVGMQVAARSIARYGGEGDSIGAQIYAAVNGTGTKAGLLTPEMKEQLVLSVLSKVQVERYKQMSTADQQKMIESYKVVGGMMANGEIGFDITGRDGSKRADKTVAADVVGQMLSGGKISNENINLSTKELGYTGAVETQLSRNLALGVDYSSDLSRTTNLTDSNVYRTVMNSRKYDDVVSEGILRYVTADPNSELYQSVSKDLGIGDPSELDNPATKERVIEQISRMRRSEGINSINSIQESEYSGEVATVMRERAISGDFNVTAWDYAPASTKASEIANIEALKDGSIREELAAAETRLSRRAVQENEPMVLLNTFATAKIDNKSTIVDDMISSGKFANITANDDTLLQTIVSQISADDDSETATRLRTAGSDELKLALKKAIMLRDVGSDRSGLNAEVLAKYLKGGDDIDTALVQEMARRGMNNGSVKSAVGVLQTSLTSTQHSALLDSAARQGTLGLTVGENRNLRNIVRGTGIDVEKLSYFEASALLHNNSPESVAQFIEHEAMLDRAISKLVEAQGHLISNDAVKAQLELGGENGATAALFAGNYSGKMQMLTEADQEQIKIAAAIAEIDRYNIENPDDQVDYAVHSSLADLAKAVQGNPGLSARIEVAGIDAVDAENRQRLALGMGERIKMYAADIQADPSLYNKARSAFRASNPGKDLDEVDSMTRNNYLANEFVKSLSQNDRNLVNSRRNAIDIDYISKITGITREEAKALMKEASIANVSIDSLMLEKGLISPVDALRIDSEIMRNMDGREFVELYNEARRENYTEELYGVSKVKYNIMKNSPDATPAVDVDSMNAEQRSRYEFTRNFLQQMNRTGENPNMLANTFRNTTLYDNDRVVEEMAAIHIDGQEDIDPSLSIEEKKKRLSNEQINAYLSAHEEYKEILTSYAAADITRTLDDATREKSLYDLASKNPELDAKVRAELRADGKDPATAGKDDYNQALQELMKRDEAFRNAMYSKLTDTFDPGARLSHSERVAFFENNRVINQGPQYNTMRSINEWLSNYIASEGKDTGNIVLTRKVNLPESSAAYENWNKYIDSKIAEIKAKKGDYAQMSAAERTAEIEKLKTKKIIDNGDTSEEYVRQQEKNKRDAFAVGDFTELYSKGARVDVIHSKEVRAVISKNGLSPNGEFDVVTGKRITTEVEERHRREYAEASNMQARYRASAAMRTSQDFGENFSALAATYLGKKEAVEATREARNAFLDKFKGTASSTGAPVTATTKYEDLTPAQQKYLREMRQAALEQRIETRVVNAARDVRYDREMKQFDSWTESQGMVPEVVRYRDGSKKFTQQTSRTTESGSVTSKSAAQQRANQVDFLSIRDDRSNVEAFNARYRGNAAQYAAEVRKQVYGTSAQKAIEELLASRDPISGKKFSEQSLSIQKTAIEKALKDLYDRAENRVNSSYKYIPSTTRPYVGTTLTLAAGAKERELQRSKLSEFRNAFELLSANKSKASYDSLFNSLSSSIRNSFMNTMNAKERTAFNAQSDADKYAKLEQFIAQNYAKLSKHVKVNNFYHTNAGALTDLSGTSIKRSVSSTENRAIMRSLRPGEAVRYNDILTRHEIALRNVHAEEANYRRLADKFATASPKEREVIRKQMTDSATRLTTYERIVKNIEEEKRSFEQRIETRRSAEDIVRAAAGVGSNKNENVLNNYNIRTKGPHGRPIQPGGPLDRPMNMILLRFMERYKNQIQSMYKTEIYQQSQAVLAYTKGKVSKLSNDIARTIADNRQLRKFLKGEVAKLEGSIKANDIALRNAMSNDIGRLEEAENEMKTRLSSMEIDLSSMEKKVGTAPTTTTRSTAKPAARPTAKK